MADPYSIDSSRMSDSPAGLDRLIRRVGLALVAWSLRRARHRVARRAERQGDPRRAAGILDPDAPRAVRGFGFPPGIFR